jgi:hypothetical protein
MQQGQEARTSRIVNPAFGSQKNYQPLGLNRHAVLDTEYQYRIQNPYHQSASPAQAAQFKRLYRN